MQIMPDLFERDNLRTDLGAVTPEYKPSLPELNRLSVSKEAGCGEYTHIFAARGDSHGEEVIRGISKRPPLEACGHRWQLPAGTER